MQKWMYILLAVLVFVFAALAGFYFYNQSRLTSTPGSASSSRVASNPVKTKIESQISADCKEVSIFSGTPSDTENLLKLFKSIGSDVGYDASQSALFSPTGAQFDVQYLTPDSENSCFYVWSGVSGGDGKVAYETKTGEIKTLQVTGFVLPSPSAQ